MRRRSREIRVQPIVTMLMQGVLSRQRVVTSSAMRDGRFYKFWVYGHVLTAIKRENQIKRGRREKKRGLIEKTNPRYQNLAEQ